MTVTRLPLAITAALVATQAHAGCKKDADETVATTTPPPVANEPAPLPPAQPDPALAALNVTAVTLGTEAGADMKIATPMTTFTPQDPIVVSIDTDGAASNAEITAKLVYEDGQAAGEESQTVNTTGAETTNVTFNNANPWPTGKYMVEVWIDGTKAQTTSFDVR